MVMLNPLIVRYIESVASVLKETADQSLPTFEPKRKKKWRDDILSCLCAKSRQVRLAWKSAGCPREGPLFDEKSRLQSAVRKRVRWCAVRAERQRHQQRNKLFVAQDGRWFTRPQRRKARRSKLLVGREMMQDADSLLEIWAEHFGKLTESRLGDTFDGANQREKMRMLESQSLMNEEYLLDAPFTAEEVSRDVSRLKKTKAPGPDGLLAEHLRAGGEAVVIWLRNILNATVELESVPTVLKRGFVLAVYKGGGRIP